MRYLAVFEIPTPPHQPATAAKRAEKHQFRRGLICTARAPDLSAAVLIWRAARRSPGGEFHALRKSIASRNFFPPNRRRGFKRIRPPAGPGPHEGVETPNSPTDRSVCVFGRTPSVAPLRTQGAPRPHRSLASRRVGSVTTPTPTRPPVSGRLDFPLWAARPMRRGRLAGGTCRPCVGRRRQWVLCRISHPSATKGRGEKPARPILSGGGSREAGSVGFPL